LIWRLRERTSCLVAMVLPLTHCPSHYKMQSQSHGN
jgi:hypothetical protein